MSRINDDNYFDYAEAIHCFATLNHEGQNSRLYRVLSASHFRPGIFWTESKCEEDNSVYGELTNDNCEKLFDELCEFIKIKKERGEL